MGMSINKQDSRHLIKRSTLTGVVPTTPPSSDFTDGTWLNTDTRVGEFFANVADDKLWVGTNSGFLELSAAFGLTLSDVLANGNTSGANDISMDTSQSILSGNGDGRLSLDYFGVAGDTVLSNGATPGINDMFYQSLTSGTLIFNKITNYISQASFYNGVIKIGTTYNTGGATQYPNGIEIISTNVTATSSVLGTGAAGIFLNSLNSTIAMSTTFNVVAGDQQNVITGNNNFLMGQLNSNKGNYNIIGGQGNKTLDVDRSLIIGKENNIENAGIMFGMLNTSFDIGSSGFCTMGEYTSSTVPTTLNIDGNVNLTPFKITNGYAYRIELTVITSNVTPFGTQDIKEWKGFGLIKNNRTTALVGAFTMTSTLGDAALALSTVVVTANAAVDELDITVTGCAGLEQKWVATLQYEKIALT